MKIKKIGKVINLTESDLKRIVKRVLTEDNGISTTEPSSYSTYNFSDSDVIEFAKFTSTGQYGYFEGIRNLWDKLKMYKYLKSKYGEALEYTTRGYKIEPGELEEIWSDLNWDFKRFSNYNISNRSLS